MFTPETVAAFNKARAKPFDHYWIPEPNTGCWLWLGAVDRRGYGFASDGNGGQTSAHRRSWRLHRGPIPNHLHVLHRCDQPGCVNPEHLFLGTDQDNMDDMRAKGRGRWPGQKGSKHPSAKLTESQVLEIRTRADDGSLHQALADDFGVARQTITKIAARTLWRHL